MTTKDDALRLALEALEKLARGESSGIPVTVLIIAIREALEQPQPEPVLWVNPNLDRVTTDRKLAEKNGLYIPLYAGPTDKENLTVQTNEENT